MKTMKNGNIQTQRDELAQAWRYFRAQDRRAARAMWKSLNDAKGNALEIEIVESALTGRVLSQEEVSSMKVEIECRRLTK